MLLSESNSLITQLPIVEAHEPDATMDLVRRALRYLVDRRASGDAEITQMLCDYSKRSAVYNIDALPEVIASQLTRHPVATAALKYSPDTSEPRVDETHKAVTKLFCDTFEIDGWSAL